MGKGKCVPKRKFEQLNEAYFKAADDCVNNYYGGLIQAAKKEQSSSKEYKDAKQTKLTQYWKKV